MTALPDLREGQTVRITDVVIEGKILHVDPSGDFITIRRDGGTSSPVQVQSLGFTSPNRMVEVLAEPEPDYIDGAWYLDSDGCTVYREDAQWVLHPDDVLAVESAPPFTLIVPPGYGPVAS